MQITCVGLWQKLSKKCRTKLVGVPGTVWGWWRWGAAFSINGVVRVGFLEKVFGFGGQQVLVISNTINCGQLACRHFSFYAVPSIGEEDESADISSSSQPEERGLLVLSSYGLHCRRLSPVHFFDPRRKIKTSSFSKMWATPIPARLIFWENYCFLSFTYVVSISLKGLQRLGLHWLVLYDRMAKYDI